MEDGSANEVQMRRCYNPLSGECPSGWLKKEYNVDSYLKCLEVDYRKLLMENFELCKLLEASEKIFLKSKADLCRTTAEMEKLRLAKDELALDFAEKEASWNRDRFKLLKEREALLQEMSQMVDDIKHLSLKYMELVVTTMEDEKTQKDGEGKEKKDRKDKKDRSLFGKMINRFITKTTL